MQPTTAPASSPAPPKEPDMSATTYTTPLRAGPATTINRHLKGEWTKLRTLPSTWRTAAFAAALAIGFTAAVDLSTGQLDRPAARNVRRDERFAVRGHHRRHPARSARRANGHRGVRHRHDPLHLQRDAGQATRDRGQGRDRRGVRAPDRAAVSISPGSSSASGSLPPSTSRWPSAIPAYRGRSSSVPWRQASSRSSASASAASSATPRRRPRR